MKRHHKPHITKHQLVIELCYSLAGLAIGILIAIIGTGY